MRLIEYRRRKIGRSFPSISNLFHTTSSHHANTSGDLLFGTAKLIHQGFAYLMNNSIKGDYAEFGVYKGQALFEAISAARIFGQIQMHFCVFDSFQGLPRITVEDGNEVFREGQFKFGYEDFLRNLKKERIDLEKIEVYPGFYSESLPNLQIQKKFSFVLVDCDLYSSTIPVLNFLEDKLTQGAMLAFDDWFCYDSPNKGVRRAVNEWLQRNKDIELIEYNNFHWAGKSFIVYFKNRI